MTRGSEKAHRAGRFGARYGTSIRRRVANIERVQFQKHRCPQCLTGEIDRESTSIWECRKCGHKFAGGAYIPRTEAFGKAQAPEEQLEAVSEEFEEELESEPEPTPTATETATAETEERAPEERPEEEEAEEEPEPEAEEDEQADEAEDEEPEQEPGPRDIGELFED